MIMSDYQKQVNALTALFTQASMTAAFDAAFETIDYWNAWFMMHDEPEQYGDYHALPVDDKEICLFEAIESGLELTNEINEFKYHGGKHPRINITTLESSLTTFKHELTERYWQPARKPATTFIIGGQPGSGKTRTIMRLQKTERAMPIIGDSLRRYDPAYLDALMNDVLSMPAITADTVTRLIPEIMDMAISVNADAIIEGTWRRNHIPLNEARKAHAHNREAIMIGVMLNPLMSRANAIMRYIILRATGAPARFTHSNVNMQAINNINETFNLLCDAYENHDVDGFMLTTADNHERMDIHDMSMNDFKTCWHDSRNTLTDDERNEILFACEQGMHYDECKDESMNILNEMSA